eukprot:g5289.t1
MTSLIVKTCNPSLSKKQVVKKLLRIAQRGSVGQLKQAVEEYAVHFFNGNVCKSLSHNGETLQMKTPLHIASAHNSIKSVIFLVKEGKANPSAVRTFSWTPLMYAASRGHIEVVKILVEANVDIDDVNKENMTALYLAAREGWYHVVVYLLEVGANVNQSATTKRTPLFCALMNDHCNIVKYFINNTDADIEGRDSSLNTIWHEIAACNSLNCFQLFVELYNDNAETNDNNKIMSYGREMKRLIDLNCLNNIGQHPIHLAASEGHSEILKLMLSINCKLIDLPQHDGNTALHIACARGHLNVVEILLEFNCNVNAIGSNGRTALVLARGFRHDNIVQLLVTNNADENVGNK